MILNKRYIWITGISIKFTPKLRNRICQNLFGISLDRHLIAKEESPSYNKFSSVLGLLLVGLSVVYQKKKKSEMQTYFSILLKAYSSFHINLFYSCQRYVVSKIKCIIMKHYLIVLLVSLYIFFSKIIQAVWFSLVAT